MSDLSALDNSSMQIGYCTKKSGQFFFEYTKLLHYYKNRI